MLYKLKGIKGSLSGIKAKMVVILILSIVVFSLTVSWVLFKSKEIKQQELYKSLDKHTILNSELLSLKTNEQVKILKSIASSPALAEEDMALAVSYLKNFIDREDIGMFSSMGIADAMTGEKIEALDGKMGNISEEVFFKEIKTGKEHFITPPADCKTYPGLYRIIVAVSVIKDGIRGIASCAEHSSDDRRADCNYGRSISICKRFR